MIKNKQFNFRCDEEFYFKLKALAKKQNSNSACVIRDLVNKAYEEIL